MLTVKAKGIQGADASWCRFGAVVVAAQSQSAQAMACLSVAGVVGNMTVEMSLNGADFVSHGANMISVTTMMNVTSVSRSAVVSGSMIGVTGLGFSASRGVYCAMGGSSVDGSSWSYVAAIVASSTSASCMVPARGAGMRVVEIAMSKGGEMSRSGAQVEVVAVATVSSVWPASGAVTGGHFGDPVWVWLCGWSHSMQVWIGIGGGGGCAVIDGGCVRGSGRSTWHGVGRHS